MYMKSGYTILERADSISVMQIRTKIRMSKQKKRTIKWLCIVLAVLLVLSEPSLNLICSSLGKAFGAEEFVYKQIGPLLTHLPRSLVTYPFKKNTSEEVDDAIARAGGFIKGVCHGNTSFEQIKGAGIEWNRFDIPFPYDVNGNIRTEYKNFKARCKEYKDNGIKVMAVTPFPRAFASIGIDPGNPENEEYIKNVAVFLLNDLRDVVGAFQICNELGFPRFTQPLNTEEIVRFVGIQMEAMYPIRGDVLIGYNTAGPQADVHKMMKPYHKYCDYVGIDVYIGCFTSFGNYPWVFDMMLNYIWSFTGKPVILCEFGYISGGAPKTPDEKREVLERYGVSSEKEARNDIQAFVSRFPKSMQNRVKNEASGDWGNFIFDYEFKNHLYSEMPANVVIPDYPHTPDGQAAFYRDILTRLLDKPFVIGAFIYCYSDTESCYVCGQNDCPIETCWGLVTASGQEKPSYYAVRDIWSDSVN